MLVALGTTSCSSSKPLRPHLYIQAGYAGQGAAGSIQAGDKSNLDRVAPGHEYDRNRRRCSLGCKWRDRVAGRSDHGHLATHKIGRKCRQTIVATLGEAILDCDVLALDVASFFQ